MKYKLLGLASMVGLLATLSGCGETKTTGIEPKFMADALHKVMEADRTVYTKLIIGRLTKKEKVIKASEHWKDEKALVLPAQMFRYGALEGPLSMNTERVGTGLLNHLPMPITIPLRS